MRIKCRSTKPDLPHRSDLLDSPTKSTHSQISTVFRSPPPGNGVSATPITCPLQTDIYPTPPARRTTSALQHSKCHWGHERRHTAARRAAQGHRHFVTPVVSNFLPIVLSPTRADCPALTSVSLPTGNTIFYSQARRATTDVKRRGSPLNRLLQPTEDVKAQLHSFFNLAARRGWVVSSTPRPLYRRTAILWAVTQRVLVIPSRRFDTTHRSHRQGSSHCTGSCVGPRTGLDRCGKSHTQRGSIPGPQSQ